MIFTCISKILYSKATKDRRNGKLRFTMAYGYVLYSEFQELVHDFRSLVSDVDMLKGYVLPKKKVASRVKA